MKKRIFLITFLMVFLLSACTVQEKMSARIFISRFNENYPDYRISENEMYHTDNKYFCFFGDENNSYAVQLYTDEENNVKKICLVCNNAGKTEGFKSVAEAVIKIYAPSEDAESIINSLVKNELNYHNTQWYRYSFSSVNDTLFFSAENMKLSTETDAELTLKANDITFP